MPTTSFGAWSAWSVPRIKGARHQVRRDLAALSRAVLDLHRTEQSHEATACPLCSALKLEAPGSARRTGRGQRQPVQLSQEPEARLPVLGQAGAQDPGTDGNGREGESASAMLGSAQERDSFQRERLTRNRTAVGKRRAALQALRQKRQRAQ
ncbi:hypothetical protein ACFL5O_03370 [Myxococcota bacterium]